MKHLVVPCVGAALLLPSSLAAAPASAQTEYPALPPGYPSLDAPWQAGKKAPKPRPTEAVADPSVATPANAPADAGGLPELQMPEPPKPRNHQVSASGDFFLGEGNVTMPFGFSLQKIPGLGQNIEPNVAKPDRTSDYIGATISYSYQQTWFLDVNYLHGESSGQTPVRLGNDPGLSTIPSDFQITDDWYQAYIGYAFPGLRGKRLKAYLRAGVSFVQADLTDKTVFPAVGLYEQTDTTEDLLGNLGFGLRYSLYSTPRIRFNLFFEGEGFYGQRTQDTKEVLPEAGVGFPFPTASIDNDLYGGIGRFLVRVEYRFSDAFNAFADVGVQGKYLQIDYPGLGGFDELLWGPYAKVGLTFNF